MKSRPLEYESGTKPSPTPPSPEHVPIYRKVLSAILGSAGIILAGLAAFQHNPAARVNFVTGGLALIVFGVLVRYRSGRF